MSNNDSEGIRQAANEPAVTGASDKQSGDISASAQAADAESNLDENLDDMSTDELLSLSRAAESRVNVFTQLADVNAKHQPALDKAAADFRRYADALKEHNYDPTGALIDPRLTVPDKEGTAPTLADATGTFAADAETANVGGIGINDSNADPEGAVDKLQEQASRDMLPTQGTSPLMAPETSLRARREAEGNVRRSTRRVPLRSRGEPV